MGVNKVVFGNQILVDLTTDTVTPENLLKGITAYDKTGSLIVGLTEVDNQGVKIVVQPTAKGANKVVFANESLIDLTNVTVTPSLLLAGATAHDKSGKQISGVVTGVRKIFEFPFSNESLRDNLIEFGEIIS